MKPDARQVGGFLRNPGACRAVLLYGEDEGLIRERARQLTLTVAESLNDPFRVVELDRDGWPRIAEEMTAMSLIGGRRVVRVREVTDAATDAVRAALRAGGDTLLVLEAPGLGKGKLRTLLEAAPNAAAISCYREEGRALQDSIRAMLSELGAGADAEAIAWLAESLGGDRAVVRGEVEKLALLAGAGGRVDVEMARASAGDAAGASGDEGLLAATRGDTIAADQAVETAIAEGLAPIALIRMALGHLQRLHQARLRMADGISAADAIRSLRPPVFFKAVTGMTASLSLWPVDGLARAIEEARTVEIACKQTGSRQELLVRRFVAGLARQSRARLRG
jgi:DNA polymerase III subunit delta